MSLEEVRFIKTENPLTVGELKKWWNDNKISDDTPIGIYLSDSERGDIAFGVVADTKDEIDDDFNVINFTETTGEHCYCKNINLLQEANRGQVVMITDGCHSEGV